MMQRTEGVLAVPDPDLETRRGGLRASVWSKNRGRAPRASPLDPPLFGICPRLFQGETLLCKGLTTSTLNIQCVEYDIKPILFKDETVIPRGLAYFPPVPSMPT